MPTLVHNLSLITSMQLDKFYTATPVWPFPMPPHNKNITGSCQSSSDISTTRKYLKIKPQNMNDY